MSLTYTTFQNSVATMMPISVTDPNFIIDFPNIIDYAEQRIYRELDLLATRVTDYGQLTTQKRTQTLPTNIGTFLVPEEINVFTPAGTAQNTGTRVPLVPVSKQFIDWVYPNAAQNNGVPEFFAVLDNQTILLGPSPDAGYQIEVTGTQRPAPLSSNNPTTFLSMVLPDLFLAAAMVRASAFQKNWSAASDDPNMAVTWEKQYQTLKASASIEELRKQYRSQAWTAELPSPIATPPRA